MLDIDLLLVISLTDIFSHSVPCLFILWMVSFAGQKLVSLIRSHLFIFAFISFDLGQRVFCLCFPLGALWYTVVHLGI